MQRTNTTHSPMRSYGPLAILLALALAVGCASDTAPTEGARFGVEGRPDADAARYIVAFRPGVAGRAIAQAAGGNVELDLPSINAHAVTLPAPAVEALRRNPNVEFVEPDARRYPMAQTPPYGISMVQANDPVFNDLFDDLPGEDPNESVLVCIIDSGYAIDHEDLQDSAVDSELDRKGNLANPDYTTDYCGHGTHVAGTIAALDNDEGVVGVMRDGVALQIIQVFSGEDCAWTYSSKLIDALEACQAGADRRGFDHVVVNMSLGGYYYSRAEDRAFAAAARAGVISVAASGNEGDDPDLAGMPSYPASNGGVISVAAVDSEGAVASFSQWNSFVDVAAPGVAVRSTVPFEAPATIAVGVESYNGNTLAGTTPGNNVGAALPIVDGGFCTTPDTYDGSIVLCQRGAYFSDMTANVLDGNGLGMVIFNHSEGLFSASTGGTVVPETFLGMTLSLDDGQAVRDAITAATDPITCEMTTAAMTYPANAYEAWNGTSMATPHVAGVAALLWAAFPAASSDEIIAALESSAADLGDPGYDVYTGHGLIQAADAYNLLACDGASEVCDDGFDNDCDGAIDLDDTDCQVVCTDADADDFCAEADDCNDGNAAVNPDAPESCDDGIDNDCDREIDEDCGGCGFRFEYCDDASDCCSGRCDTRKNRCR